MKEKAQEYRFTKFQKEVGCLSCRFFDIEAARQEKPYYCLAPVKFGDRTIETFMDAEGICHRCLKREAIERPELSRSLSLLNGCRKVARQ